MNPFSLMVWGGYKLYFACFVFYDENKKHFLTQSWGLYLLRTKHESPKISSLPFPWLFLLQERARYPELKGRGGGQSCRIWRRCHQPKPVFPLIYCLTFNQLTVHHYIRIRNQSWQLMGAGLNASETKLSIQMQTSQGNPWLVPTYMAEFSNVRTCLCGCSSE